MILQPSSLSVPNLKLKAPILVAQTSSSSDGTPAGPQGCGAFVVVRLVPRIIEYCSAGFSVSTSTLVPAVIPMQETLPASVFSTSLCQRCWEETSFTRLFTPRVGHSDQVHCMHRECCSRALPILLGWVLCEPVCAEVFTHKDPRS